MNLFDAHTQAASSNLTQPARHLFTTMAKYALGSGRCFASVASLAKDLGATPRAVQKWLRELEEGGWIEGRSFEGRSTEYLIKGDGTTFTPRGGEPRSPQGGANHVQGGANHVQGGANHVQGGANHVHPNQGSKKESKEKENLTRTPTHAPTRTHATREGQSLASGDASFSLSQPQGGEVERGLGGDLREEEGGKKGGVTAGELAIFDGWDGDPMTPEQEAVFNRASLAQQIELTQRAFQGLFKAKCVFQEPA